MAPFPLNLNALLLPVGTFMVFLAIGFAFGYTLEIAGFGNSKKLAAQFYFKDLTVLKVMFGAIIVAMVLLYGASAMGLLDLNLIWVNPTFLWPGIVGGLIMGVGFILGGFCPGTSLVGAVTLKLDAIFYVLGVIFGIFLFGETVDLFSVFWTSSDMGRFTLPEWLGVPAGAVVVGVVLMALFMFWGGEQLERIMGGVDLRKAPKARYLGAGAIVVVALGFALVGQPSNADRWERLAEEKEFALVEREVQIEPAELLATMHDHQLNVVLLDVRSEADYNLFHLADARHTPLDTIPSDIPTLLLEPSPSVFVVMSNDEAAATQAWKALVAESLPNVYILEGGINGWLDVFAPDESGIEPSEPAGGDMLRYRFEAALGGSYMISDPDPHLYEMEYEKKIELEIPRGPLGGGCG